MGDAPTQPADVNEGFPNPLSPDFQGQRTPEEQLEFARQEHARAVARGDVDPPEPPTALATGQATPEDVAGAPPA